MKLEEIREFLVKRFPKVDPLLVLPSIRGDIDVLRGEGNEDEILVTDMFVTNPLGYITLELEDSEQKQPAIIRVFSFARGPDVTLGAIPNTLVVDLIEAKYGYRPRFPSGTDSELNTILGWQSQGMWRAGVQLFVNDEPSALEIDHAIQFADTFARLVSSVTIDDLWRLRSKFRSAQSEGMASLMTNLQARIFEDRVAGYIRRKHGYLDIETRFPLSYLPDYPLDVYALKMTTRGSREVTVCECKLVLEDRPITRIEVLLFKRKAEIAKAQETEVAKLGAANLLFNAWFVTNAKDFADLDEFPVDGVTIMVATIPRNWSNQDSWEVTALEPRRVPSAKQDSHELASEPDVYLKDLDQFMGSLESPFGFNPTNIKGSVGVQYLMRNGYSWFVTDAVVSIWWDRRLRDSKFLAVRLKLNKSEGSARMTIEDGNYHVFYSQTYQKTNAKKELVLFYEYGVLLLANEH